MSIVDGVALIKETIEFLKSLGLEATAVDIKEQIECETGEKIALVIIQGVLRESR